MEPTLEKQEEAKHEETPLEAFASICGVLVVGVFVLTFIFQNFAIPSSSMVKALLVGDHVLVDRITLAPPAPWAPFVYYRNVQHGDIVVFYKPTLEPDGSHHVSGEAHYWIAGRPDSFARWRGVSQWSRADRAVRADAAVSGLCRLIVTSFRPCRRIESTDVTAEWAEASAIACTEWRSGSSAGHVFCHGRQPPGEPRQPVLGICAAAEYCGAAAVCLLVVRYAGERAV